MGDAGTASSLYGLRNGGHSSPSPNSSRESISVMAQGTAMMDGLTERLARERHVTHTTIGCEPNYRQQQQQGQGQGQGWSPTRNNGEQRNLARSLSNLLSPSTARHQGRHHGGYDNDDDDDDDDGSSPNSVGGTPPRGRRQLASNLLRPQAEEMTGRLQARCRGDREGLPFGVKWVSECVNQSVGQ